MRRLCHFQLTSFQIQEVSFCHDGRLDSATQRAIYFPLKTSPPCQLSEGPYARHQLSISTEYQHQHIDCGFLGWVNIQKQNMFSKSRESSTCDEERLVHQETVVKFNPSFLRYSFDLVFYKGFNWVPRALRFYPRLSEDIGSLALSGKLPALQLGLEDGSISPFALDDQGQTLLYVSSEQC